MRVWHEEILESVVWDSVDGIPRLVVTVWWCLGSWNIQKVFFSVFSAEWVEHFIHFICEVVNYTASMKEVKCKDWPFRECEADDHSARMCPYAQHMDTCAYGHRQCPLIQWKLKHCSVHSVKVKMKWMRQWWMELEPAFRCMMRNILFIRRS